MKKVIFSCFIIIVSFILLMIVFYMQMQKKKAVVDDTPKWKIFEDTPDFITLGGDLVTLNQVNRGGIRFISADYVEKTRNFEANVTNIFSGKTEIHTILENYPEFSKLRFLQNAVHDSKIWIVLQNAYQCEERIEKANKEKAHETCAFSLFEYDFIEKKLQEKAVIKKLSNKQLTQVLPLAHDKRNNVVWMNMQYKDKEEIVSEDPTTKQKKKLSKVYESYIVGYEADTGNIRYSAPVLGAVPDRIFSFGAGESGRVSVADLDNKGNLYVTTVDLFGNTRKISQVSMKEIKDVNFFQFGRDTALEWTTPEFVIDEQTNQMVIVTKTWDSMKKSEFFLYDLERERTVDLGVQPNGNDDDVRGITMFHGKLLAGFFHGIGVYDLTRDEWRTISTIDGIKDNNVETIWRIGNDGVCVVHGEKRGTSCMNTSFSSYIETFFEK